MEFFPKITGIDFMRLRRWAAIFSLLIAITSLWSLWHFGLNLGLDFTGGTQIEVRYEQAAPLSQMRQKLEKAGLEHAVVQSYGSSRSALITVPPQDNLEEKALEKKVLEQLPKAKVQRIDFVGPHVGKELAVKGGLAILVSLIGTMIYILLRFEYRFAVSSTLALVHDPILILGVFSWMQLEFDLISLGALLAILGYSLNDTVVVFDRVRENFRKLRKAEPSEVVNLSINQTLSRTIMTSGLTLLVVIALFFYGGPTLRGFAVALIVGILIGTYSSIYIAGSFAVWLGLNRQDLLPKAKPQLDDRP